VGIVERIRRAAMLAGSLAVGLVVVVVLALGWAIAMSRRVKRYKSALVDLLENRDKDDQERQRRLVELIH
jgi:hypothetical protein